MITGLLVIGVSSLSAQSLPDLEAEQTPLHWAAEHGLYSITQQLVENGALATASDQFGRTPLHLAVPFSDIVLLLLGFGADVNTADMFGRTPLHAALPYPETVAILLNSGADITAEDFLGDTPLERTLRYGTRSRNLEVIRLLLAAGAGAPRTNR